MLPSQDVLLTVGLATLGLMGVVLAYPCWLGRRAPDDTLAPQGIRTASPLPSLDVIVAIRNEADCILEKLDDLQRTDYPSRNVRIWIVDGASEDETADLVANWIQTDDRFVMLRHPIGDKTSQLNSALRRSSAAWVLVTDADARLRPDSVRRLNEALQRDVGVGVVGSTVNPRHGHPLELLHWRLLNRVWLLETKRSSASIVTAPCYLFRRSVLAVYPEDVVADDIHAAFAAHAAGERVAIVDAGVTEARAPGTIRGLFNHKFRKAQAYLREVVRFAPRVHEMKPPDRVIFWWRAAQLVVAPLLAVVAVVGLLVLLSRAEPVPAAAIVGSVVLGGWMASRRLPAAFDAGCLFAFLIVVLLASLVTYPFSSLSASFSRIVPAEPGSQVDR